MVWLAWPFGAAAVAVAFAATALGVLLWRMPAGAEHFVRDVTARVFAAAYVPLLCSFAALMVVQPDGAAACSRSSSASSPPTSAATPREYWRASTRWRPRSARRSPGRASGARRSPGWSRARSASSSCCTGPGGRACSPARCSSSPPRSATSSSRSSSATSASRTWAPCCPGHGGLLDRLDSLLPTALVAWAALGLLVPAATGRPRAAIPSPNIWHWPEVYAQENAAQDVEGAVWAALRDEVPWTDRDVLDVGCGDGFHLRFFDGARSVLGVEPYAPLVERAQATACRWCRGGRTASVADASVTSSTPAPRTSSAGAASPGCRGVAGAAAGRRARDRRPRRHRPALRRLDARRHPALRPGRRGALPHPPGLLPAPDSDHWRFPSARL